MANTFLTTKYFQIIYFLLSLSIVITLPASTKFSAAISSFSEEWVTPHRSYRGSLTLNPIRAPNFQFKIEMEKDIFENFSFHFKIRNWKMIKNCQFSITNFYRKIENW